MRRAWSRLLLVLAVLLSAGCQGVSLEVLTFPPPPEPRLADVEVRFGAPANVTVSDQTGYCGTFDERTGLETEQTDAVQYSADQLRVGFPLGKRFKAFSVFVPTDVGERAALFAVLLPSFRGPGRYQAGKDAKVVLVVASSANQGDFTPATTERFLAMSRGAVVLESATRARVEGEFTALRYQGTSLRPVPGAPPVRGAGTVECVLVST